MIKLENTYLVTMAIIFASTDAKIREQTHVRQDACVVSKYLPTGAY